MARIGDIYLGGHTTEGEAFFSAVAFYLSSPAAINHLYVPENSSWEVELKTGHEFIVARNRKRLTREQVLREGFEFVQRCLDILAVTQRENLSTKAPGDTHILLFDQDDRLVLQHVDTYEERIKIHFTSMRRDPSGTPVASLPTPNPTWNPAFRYYRLSQTSEDIFEAYRNLYLAFETLLDQIYPKNNSEREGDWLKQALKTVSAKVALDRFAPPGCSNAIDYLIGTLYEYARNHLFHAKTGKMVLPHKVLNPEKIAAAYERLVTLWNAIASSYLSVQRERGIMTYGGFKHRMDLQFSKDFGLYLSEDSTPPSEKDTKVSPLNLPTYRFTEMQYFGQTMLGQVAILGAMDSDEVPDLPVIHRICLKVEDTLVTVSPIVDGLVTNGAERIESLQIVKLVNRNLPKTVF